MHAPASIVGAVDAVTGLLDGARARQAFLLRSRLDPPWSMRIEDEAPLTVVCVVRGQAWLLPDGRPAIHLLAGAVAVLRGPAAYVVADDPATPPQVAILPGQVCKPLTATGQGWHGNQGLRTWGNSSDGATVLVTGVYQLHTEVSRRLLLALPPVLWLAAETWGGSLVGVLDDEVSRDDPGQEAVLDRLLDLVLLAALRTWLARPEAAAPGWYVALGDPVVGPALRSLHDDPARPWTVATLAGAGGVSRAAFARRFAALVGQPPMAYLTEWRLTLAADLLREPDQTVAAVARKVGYGSPFALSAAFSRVRGVSPSTYRPERASS